MYFLLYSVVFVINVLFCDCVGIFHEKSKIVFRPDDDYSQYFGYALALTTNRLIVGAPRARSRFNPKISPGSVFICPINDIRNKNVTCKPIGFSGDAQYSDRIFKRYSEENGIIVDDMWLGAAVAAVPKGKILMCGPRWAIPYKETHLLANGECLLISKLGNKMLPLADNFRQAFKNINRTEYGEYDKFLSYYAYAQYGFSVKVSSESIIIGAPGLLTWTGGIVHYRFEQDSYFLSLQPVANPYFTMDLGPDEYFGYSVESGVFEEDGTTLFVAGAPRSKGGYGQVLIFEPAYRETDPLNIKAKVIGPQLGAYFGGYICCVDINGDGISDLLVGAPNFVRRDGSLHYDQGAVFVYLTEKGPDSSIVLTPADYVTGSSENGNRFGSAIVSLGDVDGDGFNDIAIGAPYDDEGQGAVYIFKGSKYGLETQYVQKISVQNTKTFGFSISSGIDINKDDCNDISIGAFNISTAYILTCVPTMHVEATIKVPDAMNLQQNATNFTALFCVKAVQRKNWKHVKISFTAKITIDPKEHRAQITGDSEYDITILPGSENCDEQTVEVKPTADLSRPISLKFVLTEKDSWDDSVDLPRHSARLSDDSKLESSFDIQLIRDCGEDMICKPWLVMSLDPLNSTYVPGTDDKLGVKVTVLNKEEPSFGGKVQLVLPFSPKRLPSECSLEELNVTCNLPAPLRRSESIEYEIELEYIYKDTAEEISVVARLEDPLYNETDVHEGLQEQVILITPKASFAVSGRALPNTTITVTREKLAEAANVTFQHYYEVTNFGPSDWFRLRIQLILPEKVDLSNQISGCSENGTECTWMMPAKTSKPVVLSLRLDLGLYGTFLEEKMEYNITTTILLRGENKTFSITTKLVLEPAPPIWPIIVGSIAGLVLLSLIVLMLYKCGFFSRKRLENFEKLNEELTLDEPSTSADLPETSSQELIVDDSD